MLAVSSKIVFNSDVLRELSIFFYFSSEARKQGYSLAMFLFSKSDIIKKYVNPKRKRKSYIRIQAA